MRRANPPVRTIWQGPAVPDVMIRLVFTTVICPAGLHAVLRLP